MVDGVKEGYGDGKSRGNRLTQARLEARLLHGMCV